MSKMNVFTCNFNDGEDLVAATVKTLTFKDADGNQSRCHKMFLRIDDGGAGDIGKVHYKTNINTDTDPDTDCQYMDVGGALFTIEAFATDLRFLTANANCKAYVDVYSYEDISGSTWA